jgi:NAD(P)H dehydrogenase (quinone)
MSSHILVTYYSTFGHVHTLAEAVAAGARAVGGSEVRMRRVPELEAARRAMAASPPYVRAQEMMAHVPEVTHDDLRWADGIAWGTPTRFGNMSAQLKQFIDTTGGLWQRGELEDKPAGVFTSTSLIHGGQEATVLTSVVPLLHLGMVFVGSPAGENPQIMTADGVGGSFYGPGTIAGVDGARQPVESELETARNLGGRLARMAAALRPVRRLQRHGQQPDAPTYQAA